MTPEDLAGRLDEHGILRPGALEAPRPDAAFTVFGQRKDAWVDAAAWQRHAAQFFAAQLTLSTPKRYTFDPPDSDAALVRVATDRAPPATRLCFGRPRTGDDLRTAEAADVRPGAEGLALLARRCEVVWMVEAESGVADAPALLVSAVLASVLLGPILAPGGRELFGVRTAREKLDALAAPYR